MAADAEPKKKAAAVKKEAKQPASETSEEPEA
jgi:hypothetical protein